MLNLNPGEIYFAFHRAGRIYKIIWTVFWFSSQMLDKSRWHGIFAEIVLEEIMEFGAAIMLFMVLLKYPLNISYSPTESP
jgi:hypothetical protein